MKREELEKLLDEIDGSVAVECMDNEAFYVLANSLNDELNEKTMRVNDLLSANKVLTKMRSRLRQMFDMLEDKDAGGMSICEARKWLLEC